MPGKQGRRGRGATRELRSGRWQASRMVNGERAYAPITFDSQADAEAWLNNPSGSVDVSAAQRTARALDAAHRKYLAERRLAMAAATESFVYVITNDANTLIKIGHSRDVRARLIDLQTGSPVALTVAATYPGGRMLEKSIHCEIEDARSRGEWYDLGPFGPAIVAEMVALLTGTT